MAVSPPLPCLPTTRATVGRHPVLALLAAWTAVACVLAAQTQLQLRLGGQPRPFLPLLGLSLAGCAPWVLYTPGLVWLARQVRALRARHDGIAAVLLPLLVHLAVGGALAAADGALWATVAPWFGGSAAPWGPRFAAALLLNAFLYTGLVLFTAAADHATLAAAREREAVVQAERAAALQAQLDAARLRMLEAQIRPHFLHNTLNVIAELVHEAPDRADAMLAQLGLLLRRGLGSAEESAGITDPGAAADHATVPSAHLVPLAEELRFVRAYGALLGERFGERVRLTIDVPASTHAVAVPAYLLQPLVENAFEHGVRRRAAATLITIRARIVASAHDASGVGGSGVRDDAAVLELLVRDAVGEAPERGRGGDAPAMRATTRAVVSAARAAQFAASVHAVAVAEPADSDLAVRPTLGADADLRGPELQTAAPSRGVGLRNTRERLRTLYGDAAGLTLTRDDDATSVEVWLPATTTGMTARRTTGGGTR